MNKQELLIQYLDGLFPEDEILRDIQEATFSDETSEGFTVVWATDIKEVLRLNEEGSLYRIHCESLKS